MNDEFELFSESDCDGLTYARINGEMFPTGNQIAITLPKANRLFKEWLGEKWVTHPRITNYEVSSWGRIRHLVKQITLRSSSNGRGYLHLTLNDKTMAVHSLVAETFLGPKPAGLHVCHLDGNRTNNHIFNLKYATALENQSHRFAHGTILRNEKHPQSKLSFSKANEIRALFKKTPGKYSNSKELAEKFGVSQSTIRNIINGNAWPDKRLRKLIGAKK